MTSETDIIIFDRTRTQHNRTRAAQNFSKHDFLFTWSQNQLHDRLMDINRSFEQALHIGSRIPITKDHPKVEHISVMDITQAPITETHAPYIQASEDFMPLAQQSLDLIASNMNLHSVNDLPGALIQIRQALKPDGLFMASMLGGETLHELRQIMGAVELELYGGQSPHVAPFADKPQMGDLLQRAGFALPVVDSDIITVTYDNVFKLFHDLRGMGEGNAISARYKKPRDKTFFMRIAQAYHDQFAEEDGRIIASFEVIFLLGWSPHNSQQKPLRPGSAKNSLAEALGGAEFTTGEKATP